MPKHAAKALLKEAFDKGWYVRVDQGDDYWPIAGGPATAWKFVEEVEEANVRFYEGEKCLGVAFLMAEGPMSCAPDETIVDYSVKDNEFTRICDRLTGGE